MIAMALAANPALLLADEPTTALDVVVQAGILRLLADLRREEGMGLLLVSHDLAVVGRVADRVAVMYAGQIVEEGPVSEVLFRPHMPYTIGLIASVRRDRAQARLTSIPGTPPPPGRRSGGCRFASRCPLVIDACRGDAIPRVPVGPDHWARCIRTVEARSLTPLDFASHKPELIAEQGHG
jgi:peptide/nickel transport system ATP-binding protein